MALLVDESFVSGIPTVTGGFATAQAQAGALTVTYNAAQQAVDLVHNTAANHSYWDIVSVPSAHKGEFEADLEFVADPASAKYVGLFGIANNLLGIGYQGVHAASSWRLTYLATQWAASGTNGVGGATDYGLFFGVGDRRTFNMRWDFTAGAQYLSVEFRVDTKLIAVATFTSLTLLRPAVYLSNCTVRVHSVKAWDAPQVPMQLIANKTLLGGYIPRSFGVQSGGPAAKGIGSMSSRSFGIQSGAPGGRVSGIGAYLPYVANLRGYGTISGTLKVSGSPSDTPIARRLRAYEDDTGLLFGETWSNAVTGAYQFLQTRKDKKYTVVAFDYTNTFQSVVADNLTPS